ncbi:MAG TPA: cytochrome P450 [Dehalococcoidia bacterium]|nr:cytochrome P450 [Dehalococcoidia bacterium]
MVTAEFNPFAPGMLAHPYEMYRELRESDPIHRSEMMESWVLTRYDDIDKVLTDNRFSADRNRARTRFAQMMEEQRAQYGPMSTAQTMLTSDPPEHTRLRRLVSKAFTPRAVENLRPRIQEIVDYLLAEAGERGAFDIVHDLAYPLPVIVIAEMLGVPPEDRHRFKEWSDKVVATLGGPFTPPDVLESGRVAIEELAEYLGEVIAERRAEPKEDLISGLIVSEEGGQVLSEEEIFATCILLLIAGNETTTNLIGTSMLALFRNPDQIGRLRETPTLIRSAVEELLRYAGPVHGTGRVPKEDVEIAGHVFHEGEMVFTLLAAGNRDPAHYENPDVLDIARNPTDHLALGDGIHFCLGAPLARAEAQIAIGSLVQRFPMLRLLDEEPEWGGTFIIRGPRRLNVGV